MSLKENGRRREVILDNPFVTLYLISTYLTYPDSISWHFKFRVVSDVFRWKWSLWWMFDGNPNYYTILMSVLSDFWHYRYQCQIRTLFMSSFSQVSSLPIQSQVLFRFVSRRVTGERYLSICYNWGESVLHTVIIFGPFEWVENHGPKINVKYWN